MTLTVLKTMNLQFLQQLILQSIKKFSKHFYLIKGQIHVKIELKFYDLKIFNSVEKILFQFFPF